MSVRSGVPSRRAPRRPRLPTLALVAAALSLPGAAGASTAGSDWPVTVRRDGAACTWSRTEGGAVTEACPGGAGGVLISAGEALDVPGTPRVVRRGTETCLHFHEVGGALVERCAPGERRVILTPAEAARVRAGLRRAESRREALRRPAGHGRPATTYGARGTWDGDLGLSFSSIPQAWREPDQGRVETRTTFLSAAVEAGWFASDGVRLSVFGAVDSQTLDGAAQLEDAPVRISARAGGGLLLLLGTAPVPEPHEGILGGLRPFLAASGEALYGPLGTSQLTPGVTAAAGLRGPISRGAGVDLRVGWTGMWPGASGEEDPGVTGGLYADPAREMRSAVTLRLGLFTFVTPK